MTTPWNARMLAMASLVAGWSKDPSTKVGAVVADTNNRIVSLGYNGLARGVLDGEMTRDEKLRCTIHAEENALLFGGRAAQHCTIYVTHPPCARCAAKIIQAGLFKVVHSDRALRPGWAIDVASAKRMFAEAGVLVETVPTVETTREAWLAITDAAPGWFDASTGAKGLILSEDLCIRMGASLGL